MTHDHNACPAIYMASYDSKVTLKSTFNLVSAIGGMLAGVQNVFLAPRHAKSIKLPIIVSAKAHLGGWYGTFTIQRSEPNGSIPDVYTFSADRHNR